MNDPEAEPTYRFFVRIRPRADFPSGGETRPAPEWTVTFDGVLERLAARPRCFTEPDGSFYRNGEGAGGAWSLDGNLYDRGPCLDYVDLKGRCPLGPLADFFACLGHPAEGCSFEIVRRGVVTDWDEFLRLSAGEGCEHA